MREVARHAVGGQETARALDGIGERVWQRWHEMDSVHTSPEGLRELRDVLLDHVAARTEAESALDASSRSALRTAAECSLGALSVGCFPDGDQEIALPLIGEGLSSEETVFHGGEQAPTARTWLDAFETCLVSGLIWDWQRVIGLLLKYDYAPAIHEGVRYSRLDSTSDPAELAAMDALCRYLTPKRGHLPRDWPTVPLCKPDAAERAAAARRLDEAGPLAPGLRLLRVLLDDDRRSFEEALVVRLVGHREAAGPDPAPRTLLPLDALALAALAVQVHGWELSVRSGYLPPDMLGSPDALRRAADTQTNDLGFWTAK